mgnify:CR=1 FL=1
MKEVMAVIRMNMINQTKQALLENGFPAFHCRKVMGRGKRKVDFTLIEEILNLEDLQGSRLQNELAEFHRLLPKRLISIVVKDEDVPKVVETIIEVNRTGNPGDGKIFVLPVAEIYKVRTGEKDELAL